MNPSFPALALNISLAISLGAVAQWRLADKDLVERLSPRWRAAAITVDLAAMIVVLATGAAIAYVVVGSSYEGKPIAAGDRRGLVAALEWQAGWLVIAAIMPRVVALLPDARRANAMNLYGMLFAALAAGIVGLSAAIPIIGAPPTRGSLAAIVLPATALAAFAGWYFAGWQTTKPSDLDKTLAAADLHPTHRWFVHGDERIDVTLWPDGDALYVVQAQLEDVAFQQRRIGRRRRGPLPDHGWRIILAAPRFEAPVLRSGPAGWRDRAIVRGFAVVARRRPLTPVGSERPLVSHPQYKALWEWPEEYVLSEDPGHAEER
jgi:hypothetical protein